MIAFEIPLIERLEHLPAAHVSEALEREQRATSGSGIDEVKA
jgi:hypothetical protein